MTRDEIVQIAWDVGVLLHSHPSQDGPTKLERFAERIAAAEREECARVCEDADIVDFEHCMVLHQDAAKTLTNAAAAIRARGEP